MTAARRKTVRKRSPKKRSKFSIQYASLPWRRKNGQLQILLLTTRTTSRWIIPKGWPMPDCTPAACAAAEAVEEAGVLGKITPWKFGSFSYLKRRSSGQTVRCMVQVFPLQVQRQPRTWPEKDLRRFVWCTLDQALSLIGEPGPRRVIERFGKRRR